jgi:hypothetical protein
VAGADCYKTKDKKMEKKMECQILGFMRVHVCGGWGELLLLLSSKVIPASGVQRLMTKFPVSRILDSATNPVRQFD